MDSSPDPRAGDEGAPPLERELRDGRQDGLEPVRPLEIHRADSVSDLVAEMKETAFGGRQVGEAAEVLQAMAEDPDCFVVGTLSGAMTVGMMGHLLCDLMEARVLDAVVSTGALMAHGFVQAAGLSHYRYDPRMDDTELYEKGYNRVYDTLELESNLDDVERILAEALRSVTDETLTSRTVHERLADVLRRRGMERGILPTARRLGIPVYTPAFTDSELGLDFEVTNRRREMEGRPRIPFDPFLDLAHYSELCRSRPKLGIFTIGGGVPRNWAQQVGPFWEVLEKRIPGAGAAVRFWYGVRICPEPVHWGGLSGCTYSEGVSWGKFVPPEHGGRYAEVYADATIAWPLVAGAVLERMGRRGSPG
ncbi:MAG TPA: deoxyhypusine synthase family protein [bacterium]|nr:deoxyhypusine synthase family protein [bacterium]